MKSTELERKWPRPNRGVTPAFWKEWGKPRNPIITDAIKRYEPSTSPIQVYSDSTMPTYSAKDLGTTHKWSSSRPDRFTLGEIFWYPLGRTDFKRGSACTQWKIEKSPTLLGLKLQFLGCLARKLVAVLTKLRRFSRPDHSDLQKKQSDIFVLVPQDPKTVRFKVTAMSVSSGLVHTFTSLIKTILTQNPPKSAIHTNNICIFRPDHLMTIMRINYKDHPIKTLYGNNRC
jgi:hypothetical protein